MVYNRDKAVAYAHKWAFGRNPVFYDFSKIGGDCTNFISQCLYAGGAPMNHKKYLGWYYNSPGSRAPAWSSAHYLYRFLISNSGIGPRGMPISLSEIQIADVIQLSFDGNRYTHSLLVVAVGNPVNEDTVLIATHTDDSDFRPLFSYKRKIEYRCMKISVP